MADMDTDMDMDIILRIIGHHTDHHIGRIDRTDLVLNILSKDLIDQQLSHPDRPQDQPLGHRHPDHQWDALQRDR